MQAEAGHIDLCGYFAGQAEGLQQKMLSNSKLPVQGEADGASTKQGAARGECVSNQCAGKETENSPG